MQFIKILHMPAITSTRVSAVASLAAPYPAFNHGHTAPAFDLVESFSKFNLNGRRAKKIKKVSQLLQAPQPTDVITSTPTQIPIDGDNIEFDVERLADEISTMKISKPAKRLAQRQAPAVHPYKRPALTKSERILSSHGMAKRGTVSTPFTFVCTRLMPLLCSAGRAR
jgi:hypothetical protein